MTLSTCGKWLRSPGILPPQTMKVMKLTFILLTAVFLQVAAKGLGQVTLSLKNAPLEKVFKEIGRQTGYDFLYTKKMLKDAPRVDIDVKNAPVEQVLALCFKEQRLSFLIENNTIVITKKTAEPTITIHPEAEKQASKLIDINGRITNENKEPVAASVIVKGTNNGATTNNDGYFELKSVDENATLVITGVSIEAKEVKVNGQGSINVTVKVKAKEEEEVVVAYNKISQRSNVGAVTVVKGEQIQNLPNRSFDKSLQGLVPGLLVTSGNGQPGSAPNNFLLRGITTGGSTNYGSTVRNPLIVIDGVPVSQEPARTTALISDEGSPVSNPMAQFNPSDIESISVLKDAAAIALYGSKASNGVILVTTKKGKAGKTIFSFRHQTEISSRLNGKVQVLNQQEYLELLFEAYRNSNPGITDAAILADLRSTLSPVSPKFPTFVNAVGDSSFFPAPDWNNAYYNKAAITMTNEISASGGNERSNFYLNLEYTKQDGVAKKSGYDRKSLRFNYENRVSSWLKLGLNTALSYNIQDYNENGSFNRIELASPLNPIYQQDGQYVYNYLWGHLTSGANMIPNSLAATDLNINRNVAYRGLTRLYGELNFLQHFKLSSSFGVDFMLNELKEKVHPLMVTDGTLDYGGSIRQENFRTSNIITTNTLQFNKILGKHHDVGLLLGQEAQILSNQNSDVWKIGFSENPSQDQASAGTVVQSGSIAGKQTLLSYFGQANYSFRDKYFLSGSMRTDGSSQFGRNERFGSYWSIGGGWIITAEPFLKRSKSWLNYLKLRGSFGPAGNSAAIPGYLRYDYLVMLNYLGNTAVFPDRERNPGNPSIQWEETFVWNAGLELRILNDRVGITTDIYNKKTKNLIANNIPLPLATGFSTQTDNIGDIKNSGVELSISADILKNKDFSWNLNAHWSRNRNIFTKAFFPLTYASYNVANEVGREYNSFYMPIWAGVNPVNGRPMWIDSTGKASEDVFAAKNEFVGKIQPDGFGAITNTFSWKGIDLSVMLYYQYGSQILFNAISVQNDGLYPYTNQSRIALNRWQKPGDIAVNPRRLLEGKVGTEVDMGLATSTRYLFDGDFIRLSNVSLGYNFPKTLLDRFYVRSLRIFVQGHNLATWTKYSGQDPENVNSLGDGNFLYPQQRSFTIGLNVNF